MRVRSLFHLYAQQSLRQTHFVLTLKAPLMLPRSRTCVRARVRVPLRYGTRVPRDDNYERAEREERQGVDHEQVRREADGGL